MSRTSCPITIAALMFIAMPRLAAQKAVIAPGERETTTATILKLDVPQRFLMLRGADGADVGVFAPPEFRRFDELRVGDRVTITYYESTVYQLKRRHAPAPVSEEVAAVESQSSLPGATFSHQTMERVTVKAVDRKAALITVVGRDGGTVRRRVHNPSDLDGVKKGDHIEITYTAALLASISRAKS